MFSIIFFFVKNVNRYFFVLILLFSSFLNPVSNAQSKIYGIVKGENGKPLLNANVLLLNAKDSSLVKGSITSASGNYSFDNKHTGTYLITSTFTDYGQVFTPAFTINGNNDNIEIGNIILSQNNKN